MKVFANGKVEVTEEGPVTIFTINRPEVRNACDMETVRGLHDAFADFEKNETALIGILTGAGNFFSAGADLAEVSSGASIGFSWAGTDKGATRRRLSKPVIAAIEGHAVAAGLALAVWCDLRVASESAVFGVFCRRFGGPMPNGATVRLPRIIGESRALDMLMTGRPVEAKEAYHMGLADRLVPAGQALQKAKELALELASFPQTALLCDRHSAITQWDYSEKDAIDREIEGAKPAFTDTFQGGAGQFVQGTGRHGQFEKPH